LCRTQVAHGSGTKESRGGSRDPAKVSSKRGSNLSCVGGFTTKNIYKSKLGQKDKSIKQPAMNVEGLDQSNKNARNRGIRMHGAHYVSETDVRWSHGCICCKQDIHEKLIQIIQEGSFIFAYCGDENERL
jgi:hypothetical protein